MIANKKLTFQENRKTQIPSAKGDHQDLEKYGMGTEMYFRAEDCGGEKSIR